MVLILLCAQPTGCLILASFITLIYCQTVVRVTSSVTLRPGHRLCEASLCVRHCGLTCSLFDVVSFNFEETRTTRSGVGPEVGVWAN